MTDKERLDEVRDFIVNDFRRDEYPIKFYQDLAFLVHQAKRVQELEIDLNICKMSKKTIGDINRFTDEIKNENKWLLELNQSYEKAMNGLVKAIEVYSGKTAKKAMEDLVELVEAIDD